MRHPRFLVLASIYLCHQVLNLHAGVTWLGMHEGKKLRGLRGAAGCFLPPNAVNISYRCYQQETKMFFTQASKRPRKTPQTPQQEALAVSLLGERQRNTAVVVCSAKQCAPREPGIFNQHRQTNRQRRKLGAQAAMHSQPRRHNRLLLFSVSNASRDRCRQRHRIGGVEPSPRDATASPPGYLTDRQRSAANTEWQEMHVRRFRQ